jgi:hypothetical protein
MPTRDLAAANEVSFHKLPFGLSRTRQIFGGRLTFDYEES